ncbi:MAG: TIM barrel protein [Nanoarchaeota archaeon]|nr:TIM barrel protein [Nanoarchaeota archaeon]
MANKIDYGLKLWSTNNRLFKKARELIEKDLFQYIELYVVPESFDANKLTALKGFSIIIHAPHFQHNFNLSKFNLKENNKKIFQEVKKVADFFDSKFIILHPGVGGDIRSTITQLNELGSNKILIENMPKIGLNKEILIGFNLDEIKEIIQSGDFNFCLDLAHAIKSAISQNLDYKHYIKQLLQLNPKLFHISDGNTGNGEDEHLSLGKGNFDLKFLKRCIEESEAKMVTLETPKRNFFSLTEDVKNVEYLKKL